MSFFMWHNVCVSLESNEPPHCLISNIAPTSLDCRYRFIDTVVSFSSDSLQRWLDLKVFYLREKI